MPSRFTLRTDIAASPAAVFDLARDIGAHVASMHGSRESATAGVTEGPMQLGDTVTFRARHGGIWFTMTARISEMDEPTRFVDEQTRGPFRSFRHEHRFDETPDGGTRMTDTIDLASPVFGIVAERLILVPYLRRLIARRNAHLAASFAEEGMT
ncbi:SRPBCC family protein [Microbacterium sp. KSW2-29]|uniref:SRPBCC family protein n=1 Tax=Microbacterium phycohabitans TaxID=3075993 RepID=A0ABU3SIG0_9MICO|nr:SRPBCC family protein [Microbacterium sp. KSW2-29]MDU0344563.1 SRPBCC family protein [Microbacterium sp. KSW2-29]